MDDSRGSIDVDDTSAVEDEVGPKVGILLSILKSETLNANTSNNYNNHTHRSRDTVTIAVIIFSWAVKSMNFPT